jgi:trk system potassium uptake protein TrkH
MMIPLQVAIYYRGSDVVAFGYSIMITLLLGGILSLIKPRGNFRRREGLAVVGLGWIILTAVGALPFYLSGTVQTYTDAFFETMSGFTTTGATILPEIESVARGILFWRSLTHWLGGMGIIVLSLAVFSFLRQGTSLFQAEVPGPFPDKILPRLKKSAAVLWIIYTVFTLVEIITLRWAGMSLYDSFIHTFGSMATGGFSSKNISVEFFHNIKIEMIITIFMFLAGINFSLYYRAIKRRSLKPLLKSSETRVYFLIIVVATILISISLLTQMNLSVGEALRRSGFQVVSVITTTGYSSDNFDTWPSFARGILFILMFFGGCTGSTGGAIKIARIMLLFKYAFRQVQKAVNPRLVIRTKLDGTALPDARIHEILAFFFMYITLFICGALFVMATGEDLVTSLTAAAATIGNIGPGFARVGPLGNYSGLHIAAKWVLSLLMLAGRLEILPILVLFSPRFWRK